MWRAVMAVQAWLKAGEGLGKKEFQRHVGCRISTVVLTIPADAVDCSFSRIHEHGKLGKGIVEGVAGLGDEGRHV